MNDLDNMTRVAVDRLLKSPPQPRRVLVQGTTTGEPGVVTDADRTFQVGARYVFYPPIVEHRGSGFDDRGGPLKEHLCTAAHRVSSAR